MVALQSEDTKGSVDHQKCELASKLRLGFSNPVYPLSPSARENNRRF